MPQAWPKKKKKKCKFYSLAGVGPVTVLVPSGHTCGDRCQEGVLQPPEGGVGWGDSSGQDTCNQEGSAEV